LIAEKKVVEEERYFEEILIQNDYYLGKASLHRGRRYSNNTFYVMMLFNVA